MSILSFSYDTVDRYLIRNEIFKALNQYRGRCNGHLLDIGCGKMPYKSYLLESSAISEYTGTDIDSAFVYDE